MALSKEHKDIIINAEEPKTYTEWVEFFNGQYTYREIYGYISRSKQAKEKGTKDSRERLSQRQSQNARKYNINQDFFKTWSNDMAYLFGFWCADGCIYRNKLFDITVQKKDKYILKRFAELLHYEGNILDYVDRQACRLNFSCKVIYDDLIALGGKECKSLDLSFPNVPHEFLPDFIRGYFDGDGSVYNVQGGRLNLAFACGSENFIQELQNVLRKYAHVDGGSYDKAHMKLTYGHRDSLKIATFIYNTSSNLFLERKKAKFLDFINLQTFNS